MVVLDPRFKLLREALTSLVATSHLLYPRDFGLTCTCTNVYACNDDGKWKERATNFHFEKR